jgi:hypothetical protein
MANYCTNCGHQLREGEKFCAACGTPVTPQGLPDANHPISDALACPTCHRSDQVAKVSVLVSAGTATTVIGQGFYTHSRTDLSARLSLPPEPTLDLSVEVFATLVWEFGIFCAVALVVGLSQMGPNSSANTNSPATTLLVIGGIACLVITAWVFIGKRARHQKDHAAWVQHEAAWQKLYYCARDDGVFVPGQPRLTPVEKMATLL